MGFFSNLVKAEGYKMRRKKKNEDQLTLFETLPVQAPLQKAEIVPLQKAEIVIPEPIPTIQLLDSEPGTYAALIKKNLMELGQQKELDQQRSTAAMPDVDPREELNFDETPEAIAAEEETEEEEEETEEEEEETEEEEEEEEEETEEEEEEEEEETEEEEEEEESSLKALLAQSDQRYLDLSKKILQIGEDRQQSQTEMLSLYSQLRSTLDS